MFLNNDVFLSLKVVLMLANSKDTDEMQLYGFPVYKGLISRSLGLSRLSLIRPLKLLWFQLI